MRAMGSRGVTTSWLAVFVVLTLVAGAFVIGANDSADDPRPFDPLSRQEEQQAIDIVLEDQHTNGGLSRDHVVIGAALSTDKARIETDPDGRYADVWIYDYGSDETLWAVVSLGKQQLVSLDRLQDHQPAITFGEKQRAARLALEHVDVEEQLTTWEPYEEVDWLVRLWTGPGDTACPVHRCALVAFLVDGEYEPDFFVRVNLSLGRVDRVLDGDDADQKDLREALR